MKIQRLALLALVSPLALATLPAAAQQAAPADDETVQGGDIVVTAQLVEQRAKDVPFALTAYSGRFLDDRGVTQFDKLSAYVPGFQVQNQSPNNPGFVMRGITSDSGSAFNEPRVSVFQDGVSISKSRGSYVELFDLDRVEIAKGPQSTLYGRGALIGAVNLVQAKADPRGFDASAYASYGNFDAVRLDGMVNLPASDSFAVRFAGRVNKRGGYIENLLGGEDFNSYETYAFRGSARLATGPLKIDVIANTQHDKTSGTSFKSIAYNPTDPVTGAVLGNRGRNSAAALVEGPGFTEPAPLGLDRKVWGVTGIGSYDLGGGLSLSATASYRKFEGTEVFDADGISLPVLTAAEDARGRQSMETLRLTYASEKITAFVGGTYFWESGSQRTPSQFDERMALARITGALNGLGLVIPGRPASDPLPRAAFDNTAFTGQLLQGVIANATGLTLPQVNAAVLPIAQAQAIAANLKSAHQETSTNWSKTHSWDLFGDVTLHVTDRFDIGGGIRYTHDAKTTSGSSAVLNGRSIIGGFIGALTQPAPVRTQLLAALAAPNAANIPMSPGYPVPLFGLGVQPSGANGTVYAQDHDDEGVTWRATAKYALTPDANVYANYARGRRPEVLSINFPSAPGGAATFEVIPAETVDSFELGAKTALLGRTLFFDGAGFYYKYNNFQTSQQVGTTFVTINAGKAESYGVEGQLRWNPAEWFSLFGTYAWNHSRFLNGAYKGNHFRLSPDHKASLGVTLKAPVGPFKADLSPVLLWQSKQFFDDNNDIAALQTTNLIPDTAQDEVQKGYATVDARLGFENERGSFRLELFATNLLNQKYIKDAGNTGDALGMPTFIAGEPRFYGIAVRIRPGR